MNFLKLTTIYPLMMLLLFSVIACSNTQSPITPSNDDISDITEIIAGSSDIDPGNRSIIAVYEAIIDPEAETFTITPVYRESQYHFPLNQLYPNCVQITGFGFTPNFWADIKLAHPMPGSGVDAFDPRVIAIVPANPNNYFQYPIAGITGNPNIVMDSDGYTRLFNELGGAIPGNANPFIAYFKDEPYRRWSSTGQTEQTKRWEMNLDGFAGNLQFALVVDVSTNFPKPPEPVFDNAPEPVEINATVSQGLTPDGGSANVEATILDWQGTAGTFVAIEAPELFGGVVLLSYDSPGLNPDEYIYAGTISNTNQAPAGEYKILIAALDLPSGNFIYKEFPAMIIDDTAEGNLLWAKSAGGTGMDEGLAVTTLSDNSTVVTGYFHNTATFGKGEPNQTSLTSQGARDIYVARYHADGSLIWAKQAGGPNDYNQGQAITTLSDDSVIVAGIFQDRAIFGEGEPNETILTSDGHRDIFIARYNRDGLLQWAKRAGGIDQDYAHAVTTLSDDTFVVTGRFHQTAIFGKDEPNETSLTSDSGSDMFVARYRADGSLIWAKQGSGPYNHNNGDAITNLSDNSVVVTGRFAQTITFNPGEPDSIHLSADGWIDMFVVRYASNGSLLWAKKAGGANSSAYGVSIASLTDDSVVVTGGFSNTIIFGYGEPGQTEVSGSPQDNIFLARYNPDGTLAWARGDGGDDTDYVRRITSLSDNSTVITGYFFDDTVLGVGDPNETVLIGEGQREIFVARYNSDGHLMWARCDGSPLCDVGWAITSLSDNSVVVTGHFADRAIFGKDEPNETTLSCEGNRDIFVARYSP